MGGGYANDIKMSEASMERFLYAVFAPSPNWEMEVVAKQQKEMQSIRQMMDQLRGSG